MFALLLNLLLAFSVSGTVRAGAHAIVDRVSDDVNVRISDKVRAIVQQQQRQRDADSADSDSEEDSDTDSDLEAVPPPPPTPAKPGRVQIRIGDDSDADLPAFSESGHNVPAVDVLHRIARKAGWSLTIVGVAKDRIDVDVEDGDPRDAAREVLKASGSMGVLRGGKLVVVPAPEPKTAGTL